MFDALQNHGSKMRRIKDNDSTKYKLELILITSYVMNSSRSFVIICAICLSCYTFDQGPQFKNI